MHTYIPRSIEPVSWQKLSVVPIVAILGPRQCGKSTLARHILKSFPKHIILDLERPSDINRLTDSEFFFSVNHDHLICLDEIQRAPALFPVIRSTADQNDRSGQFLILGSASGELLRQSSESLAGRIAYVELTPFLLQEIRPSDEMNQLWLKGGFPRSFFPRDQEISFEWRLDFIRTFLEQDIPNFGFNIPAKNLHRFWRMLAHVHGQVFNASKLGNSLGVSGHTVSRYIDILQHTYMIRVLEPYTGNLKKRLIKSPKIYIRDAGILHALLEITSMNDLLGHPVYGSSWEGFVIEQILGMFPRLKASFYRNSNGNEIDLVLEKGAKKIAVECKASTAPQVGKGFTTALEDLKIKEGWVIAPVKSGYAYQTKIRVASLPEFLDYLSASI